MARTRRTRIRQIIMILGFFIALALILFVVNFTINQFMNPAALANNKAVVQNGPGLYAELNQAPVVQNSLKQFGNNEKMVIAAVHQNNIVELNLYSTTGPGQTMWVKKVNNQWLEIYTGQQKPPCDLLAKAGVEAGISCLNPNAATQCVGSNANTTCFYQETK